MLSINNKKNAIKLILTPTDQHSGLQPIAVTTPVFEIGKNAPFISQYSDSHAEEVSCLSRRHAAIHFEKNQYVLHDHGSTNGTLKNDAIVTQDNPAPLQDGDTVIFGNRLFSYRIKLEAPVKQKQTEKRKVPPPPQRPDPGPATAYIGKSSVDDIIEKIISDESGSSLEIEDLDKKSTEKITESPIKRFALPLLGGFALLLIGISLLSFLYFSRNSETNLIETMLADRQYDAALQLSTQNLLTIPSGSSMVTRFENYAQEAFIGLVSSPWLELVNDNDFTTARAQPQQALTQRQQTGAPHLTTISNLLTWIANLFHEQQEGVSASVYQSNTSVMEIVRQWQQNKEAYLAMMRRIETRNPQFEPIHRKVVSTLRELQVQLDQVRHSRQNIFDTATKYLNQPDTALLTALQKIASDNPELRETSRLNTELERYAATFNDDRRGCFGLALAFSGSSFEHPLILNKLETLQNRVFDSPEDLTQTQRALIEWRQGEFTNARDLLLTARCNPIDGRDPAAEIDRMSSIVTLLEQDSDESMLGAYQLFDEQYDTYYLERHRDRIANTRQKALTAAQTLAADAIGAFSTYQANGGISASMRISTQLTDSFQSQASALTNALQAGISAENIARVINVDLQSEQINAFSAIRDEADNQIGFLEELRGSFSDRALLDQKIALLKVRNE